MNQITCPHCGKVVEISEALSHQFKKAELAKIEALHKKELEEKIEKVQLASSQKVKEQFELQLKLAEDEKEADRKRIKELIEQTSELMKTLRETRKEKDEVKIEMQKKLAEDEGKIRIDAQKKAEEAEHLKLTQKDKQLESALKELEDMKRKLQQGSQQMQGEAFELEFEDVLKREFPNDQISEVAKGVKGGDIVQEVCDRNGNNCGKILWELKNTKTWSEQWVEKLKADQRLVTADWAILISETVPNTVDSAKYYNGIWVTKRNFFLGLASAIRMNLVQVAMTKRAGEGKKEKTDILYSYLSGTEFRLRIEAIVEAFTNMQTEIEKEKRYFSNKWARDEKNIRQVIDNTYGMHGDLKGILGAVLPQIKDLDELTDGSQKS